MSNSLQSRIVTINNVTYTPINTPLGVSGKSVVQQIYKNSVDGKYYILAEGGTPEELGGGGGGQVISGSLPTSGWVITSDPFWEGSIEGYRNYDDLKFVANIPGIYAATTAAGQIIYNQWITTQYETGTDSRGAYKHVWISFTSSVDKGVNIYENDDIYQHGGYTTLTSLTSTVFGFRRYTVSSSAIKVNSFVTLFVESKNEIRVVSKTDGAIVVEMDDVPTTAIPYELQIIETDSESAFWIKNTYVPTKTSQLENDSNFLNEGFYYIDCSVTAINLNDYLSDDFVGVYVLDKATSSNVSNLPSDYTGTNTVIMTRRKFADGGVSQTIEWSYGTTEIIDYKYARTPQSTAWQRMRATADVLSITIPYANFVTIAGFEPFTKYCLVTVDTKYNAGAEYELIANTLITIFATYGIALYNVEQNPSDATKTDFYFLAITAPITDMQVTVKVNYSDSLDYDA